MFVVLSIGTVFCLLVIVVCASFYYFNPHPSDRVLIRTFQAHQQDFETLVTMANEDQRNGSSMTS